MSPELMYVKFLQKINKNNTQTDIACDKERFVLLINECKNRWVESHLKEKDSILIDSLQEIIKDKEYSTGADKVDYIEYQLEPDFYEAILTKSKAQRGDCKRVLYSREVKNQDKNLLQFDDSQKPDFDFEWTFNSIQGNKLRVYKTDDFKIDSTILEYYSVIPDIQMAGTVDIDEEPVTTSIGIDIISDQYVDQIVNFAATEFMRDFENQTGVALGKDRQNSEENK